MKVYEGTTVDGARVTWYDPKRRYWMLAFAVPTLTYMAWGLDAAFDHPIWWFWGVFFVFVIIPTLDVLIGDDPSNPPEEIAKALQSDPWYRWVVMMYLPMMYASYIFGIWLIVTQNLSWWDVIGLAATVGTINGIGINAAHELGHKNEKLEHIASQIALAPSWYGHWFVEHNWGHHKMVATPQDPASSRMGESFYEFWPRTVLGTLRSAWQLEAKRLRRKGASPISPANRNLHAWVMSAVLWAAVLAYAIPNGQWKLLPYLAIVAFVGFTLLEIVNYVEHYGLLRQRTADGWYERVRPAHSWNNNHVVTNLFLYQLQRHSDHHENPGRRFVALRHSDEAPQLPAGYATMILVALVSPLWFKIMNPRLRAHYAGDLSQSNLKPGWTPARRAAPVAAPAAGKRPQAPR